MTSVVSPKRRQVFLSYSSSDKRAAARVADALRTAGLRVWFDAWELAPGDSIISRINQAVASSDFLVVLLSQKSVESQWVQNELSAAMARELGDRAVTVIPALLEDCDVPPHLAERQWVDLRRNFEAGVQQLASQLAAAPEIEFASLDHRTFERLVADLLTALGFSVQMMPFRRDSGFDFMASYRSRDPFGAEKQETWFVEVKFYKEERLSVSALRQMLGYLMTSGSSGKGLVVTSGQMTSVARDFLSQTTNSTGRELRVIDGTELTRLVVQHPTLVERYFRRTDEQ